MKIFVLNAISNALNPMILLSHAIITKMNVYIIHVRMVNTMKMENVKVVKMAVKSVLKTIVFNVMIQHIY